MIKWGTEVQLKQRNWLFSSPQVRPRLSYSMDTGDTSLGLKGPVRETDVNSLSCGGKE
jgi:hypothetical protein